MPAPELSHADAETSRKAFKALGICDELCDAAVHMRWKQPSDIQQQAIPPLIEGKDVVGLAQTGSGKTATFAIPIIQALLSKVQPFYALVLSPTRELALQIAEQFEALGSGIGLKCCALVGGVDMMQQAVALGKRPHVLVGSPGRVVDHIANTKGFSLKALRALVLDEADKLLDMDFEKEIDQILDVVPRERRTMLFSATMTSKVQKLQRASLRSPVKVEVATKYTTVKTLRQQYLFCPQKFKDSYVLYTLNELSGSTCIMFVRTCDTARQLATMLRNLGFGAVPIHGQMSQPKRIASLNKFKAGERSVLVATDVAARGLDVPDVDLVVNYDVPAGSKDYVHRVGRTARAGRSGRAVTIVTQYDIEAYQRIEAAIALRLGAFPAPKEEVAVFHERVAEAARIAARLLKEEDAKRRDGRSARKRRQADDAAAEEAAARVGKQIRR